MSYAEFAPCWRQDGHFCNVGFYIASFLTCHLNASWFDCSVVSCVSFILTSLWRIHTHCPVTKDEWMKLLLTFCSQSCRRTNKFHRTNASNSERKPFCIKLQLCCSTSPFTCSHSIHLINIYAGGCATSLPSPRPHYTAPPPSCAGHKGPTLSRILLQFSRNHPTERSCRKLEFNQPSVKFAYNSSIHDTCKLF